MSTDQSDSRGSANTPNSLTKKSETIYKPPFKLSFPKLQMVGTSDVGVSKIDGVLKFVANFITPKFYSNDMEDEKNGDEHEDIIANMVNRRMEEEKKGPRDLYHYPMLSSQSYGWWYDEPLNSKDLRFNFHRNTSEMVYSNSMIQWEDKKLRKQF